MRYFDRSGTAVSPERWRQLYGDPEYGRVAKLAVGGCAVEASWVGVAAEREQPPRPFVVLVRSVEGGRDRREPLWYATEAEALAAFDRLVDEARGLEAKGGAAE